MPSPPKRRALEPLAWLRRFRWRHGPTIWYDPAYRLPFTTLEAASGLEVRRAEQALWFLEDKGRLPVEVLRRPPRIPYTALARVHGSTLLESLSDANTLARIFGVDRADIVVDEILNTIRLATGATLAAAREALATHGNACNLLGGFHHAFPDKAGGLCPVNDIAVAVASLRADGFAGKVVVLDLDAHPPDGTAACLRGDPDAWIGSISGSDWGPLEGVDETLLPGADDATYLSSLVALLSRMPAAALTFVLAGGDVLRGDRLGRLGLSLDGARRRDLLVKDAISRAPSVWLPGGGYHRDSWRVLVGSVLTLAFGAGPIVPEDHDPIRYRYSRIFREIDRKELGEEPLLTQADLEEALGLRRPELRKLLGLYTAEGLEYALERYGFLEHLRRLAFSEPRVLVDRTTVGDRLRVMGRASREEPPDPREHLLLECVLETISEGAERLLFVHWLTLRNPRLAFSSSRPKLPGQEAPGLGLAREVGELLARMARRLGLDGVAFKPAWFHVAYATRYRFQFADPARQGRFQALMRDLSHLSLLDATMAVAGGRVFLDGRPHAWEPDLMVFRLEDDEARSRAVEREMRRVRFEVRVPAPDGAEAPGP